MNRARTSSRFLLQAALVIVSGIALCRADAPAQAGPGASEPGPDSARALLAKWMETERIIAQERSDWEHSRDMLRSRIDLLKAEIQAQQEKTRQLRESGADLGAKRGPLAADDEAARAALDALGGWIGVLEAKVRRLEPALPVPLQAKVRPLADRMPADPARTKISLAERYQNIVGILNEANKFDNDISMNSEIRTMSDGSPSEVRVVYVGLGQAYFVSPKGEAGVGRPGPEGWQWENNRGIAPGVAQVVEILQGKSKPKLVPLPVNIQ